MKPNCIWLSDAAAQTAHLSLTAESHCLRVYDMEINWYSLSRNGSQGLFWQAFRHEMRNEKHEKTMSMTETHPLVCHWFGLYSFLFSFCPPIINLRLIWAVKDIVVDVLYKRFMKQIQLRIVGYNVSRIFNVGEYQAIHTSITSKLYWSILQKSFRWRNV